MNIDFALFDLYSKISQAGEQLPRGRQNAPRVDLENKAHDHQSGQPQDGQWEKNQPQQEKRKGYPPPPAGWLRAKGDNPEYGDHFRDSSSAIASSADMCPPASRSRISTLEGDGSVSTNWRLSDSRFSRALMVG